MNGAKIEVSVKDLKEIYSMVHKIQHPKVFYCPNVNAMKDEVIAENRETAENITTKLLDIYRDVDE